MKELNGNFWDVFMLYLGEKNSYDFTIFKYVPFSNTWASWRLQPAETLATLAHTTQLVGSEGALSP